MAFWTKCLSVLLAEFEIFFKSQRKNNLFWAHFICTNGPSEILNFRKNWHFLENWKSHLLFTAMSTIFFIFIHYFLLVEIWQKIWIFILNHTNLLELNLTQKILKDKFKIGQYKTIWVTLKNYVKKQTNLPIQVEVFSQNFLAVIRCVFRHKNFCFPPKKK